MLKTNSSKLFVLCCILLAGLPGMADQPLEQPATKTIYSANKRYYSELNVQTNTTTVFGVDKRPIWQLKGWFRVAYLSDDGKYLVVGQDNINLLPLDFKPEDALLSIYSEGKLIHTLTIAEIFPDKKVLPKTVSHYQWGSYLGFCGPKCFKLKTVDMRDIELDIVSGKITQVCNLNGKK